MNNTGTRVSDLFRETLPGRHSCKGFLKSAGGNGKAAVGIVFKAKSAGVTRRQLWGMVVRVKPDQHSGELALTPNAPGTPFSCE